MVTATNGDPPAVEQLADVVRVDVAADGSSLVLTSDGPAEESAPADDDEVIEAELLDD